jgi:hypothetical protein
MCPVVQLRFVQALLCPVRFNRNCSAISKDRTFIDRCWIIVKVYLTHADFCSTIWMLLICLMQPFPPDGLMSAVSSVFLET